MTKFKITWKNFITGTSGESRILKTQEIGNARAPWWTYERSERPYMGEGEAKRFVRKANRVFPNVRYCLQEMI